MDSWPALPETRLERAGPDTGALLDAGCATLRAAAKRLHELPYGRNSDRADYRLVLPEGRGTCSTKHALLAAAARELALPVQLTIGIYEMSEANTPGVGRVLSAHGLTSLPEAHCYLAYAGRRIDVTRAGVAAAAGIEPFVAEWPIEPEQIGAHKLELHRRHLERWLAAHGELDFSLASLWAVREACIRALAEA
jgi:hypothetical protein